jgi:integrase
MDLPPMKLTTLSVENAKPAATRKEIPDALLRGLYLVVQPSGLKSWAVRYRNRQRKSKKLTIGSYPLFDLKAARERARTALRDVAEGGDPANKKQQKSYTIEKLTADFLEHYCRHNNRPKTIKLVELIMQNYILPAWRGRTAQEITRANIKSLLREIASSKPVQANRVHAVVRKLFRWAVDEEIISSSPCQGIARVAEEKDRERVLSDQELRRVWLAAEQMGFAFGDVIKVLLLTAQRRNEVSQMEWSELDLDRAIWTLPAARCKNGHSHEVQLSPQAVNILQSIPRIGDSKYVFTLNGHRPIYMSSQLKSRLDRMAKVEDWRLHDLRRSAASGMAKLGIPPHVLDKVLNHVAGSIGGIAKIYNRHDYNDERREALALWSKHIAALNE